MNIKVDIFLSVYEHSIDNSQDFKYHNVPNIKLLYMEWSMGLDDPYVAFLQQPMGFPKFTKIRFTSILETQNPPKK